MIILVRHGQTDWNKAEKFQGWNDSPLTPLGRIQAVNVATGLKSIIGKDDVSIYFSPLGRSAESKEIILNSLGNDFVATPEPLLKEYSFGHWEGRTKKDVQESLPEEWQARIMDKWNYTVPNGESYDKLAKRASKWLQRLPKNKIVLAVSHEMIGKAIRGEYLKLRKEDTMSLTQRNNEIIVLEDFKEIVVEV